MCRLKRMCIEDFDSILIAVAEEGVVRMQPISIMIVNSLVY